MGTDLTGATIGAGCQSTVVTYNSINFAGNHALQLRFAASEAKGLELDYNNYGTTFEPDTLPKVDQNTIIEANYPGLSPSRELMLYPGRPTRCSTRSPSGSRPPATTRTACLQIRCGWTP